MDTTRTLVLTAAVLATGLTAGLFVIFAHTIMPSLGAGSDRTFVEAMKRINATILNPWFFAYYLGGGVFILAAAVLHVNSAALVWIVVAGVLYAATLISTARVNVPLNNQLDGAGLPDDAVELALIRARFEQRWVRWNNVRTVTSLGAFAAISVALASVSG